MRKTAISRRVNQLGLLMKRCWLNVAAVWEICLRSSSKTLREGHLLRSAALGVNCRRADPCVAEAALREIERHTRLQGAEVLSGKRDGPRCWIVPGPSR